MFCVMCGKSNDNGADICAACAGKTAIADNELELNVKPKRSKKRWIIGTVLAAVLVAVVLIAVFWDAITGGAGNSGGNHRDGSPAAETTLDTAEGSATQEPVSGSPEERFKTAGRNGAAAAGDVLAALFEQYSQPESDGTGAGSVILNITCGEALREALEYSMDAEDLSFPERIVLGIDYNMPDDALGQIELSLALAGTDILTCRSVLDVQGETVYLGFPEHQEAYLYMRVEEVFEALGIDYADLCAFIEQSGAFDAYIRELMPTREQCRAITDRYAWIVLGYVDSVEAEQTVLETETLSTRCDVLTLAIDREMMAELISELLDTAADDGELKQLAMALMGAGIGYTGSADIAEYNADLEDLWEDYFDSLLDSWAEVEFDETDDRQLLWKLYMTEENAVIGCEFEFDGESIAGFYRIEDGTGYAETEGWIAEMRLIGTTRVNDQEASGEFRLYPDGKKYYVLLTYDIQASEDQTELSGRVSLDFAHYDAFGEDALLMEMAFTLGQERAIFEMNISAEGALYLGIGAEVSQREPISVQVPEEAVHIMDEAALALWLEEFDVLKLLSALESAGIPTDPTALAEENTNSF